MELDASEADFCLAWLIYIGNLDFLSLQPEEEASSSDGESDDSESSFEVCIASDKVLFSANKY